MNANNAAVGFSNYKHATSYLASTLLLLTCLGPICRGQTSNNFRYFYDDLGQLIKVIDSTGIELDYTYDAVGNILRVTRGTAPAPGALSILNFTPQSGGVGVIITLQGQNFAAIPASNAVTFNGAPASVLAATTDTLTVAVPAAAATGPISVTVGGQTATSTNNFTFIPGPAILSVSPQYFVSSATASTIPNFQVTGVGLTGASFTFAPAFSPALIAVSSATINAAGTSATLNLTISAGTVGSFTVLGSSAGNTSSQTPATANTVRIITPDGDADGDGLTNTIEIAIGANPLNPNTSGDGVPDGWQVFYGLNPLDPTVAAKDLDNSGLTVLQDFQQGLNPRNPNLVPPTVSQITPRNGATTVFVNDAVVVRFSEPLLTGTSLSAAQSAIAALLGSNTTVSASSQQIAASTLQAYMNRTCCGNSVVAGTVVVSGPAGSVAGTVTPSADGLSAKFAPSRPLQSNTNYTVQVRGVKDTAGNVMTAAFTSSFTTGASLDQGVPQITLTSPSNGAGNVSTSSSVAVMFSKPIDPTSVTAASFSVLDTTANLPIAGSLQVDQTNTIATFVPAALLPSGHSFAVTLTAGIKDLANNAIPGTTNFGFSTGGIQQEVDSVTLSLLNSNGVQPTVTTGEADSLTFSVLNGGATVQPHLTEADSVTFSVLNGTIPVTQLIRREADSFTFSLLNGSSPVTSPALKFESDGLTFSLLNGETPVTGVIKYEADGVTFSLHNISTGSAKNVGTPPTRVATRAGAPGGVAAKNTRPTVAPSVTGETESERKLDANSSAPQP